MISKLEAYESLLQKQAACGDVLLGQLPLGQPPYNQDDMRRLGRLLASRFALYPFKQALRIIEKRYPLSFALYLVLQGIYNYRAGEYWSTPGEELKIQNEAFFSSNCGQTFRRILKQFQLPTFAHIEGHRNLVPILAHGGIPNYSLGDFFRLIHKSVRGSMIAVDAETLREEWAANAEETFFFIDRPVQRFVLHGGGVAEDFITRCLNLISAETEAEIAELDLPQRVVDAYQTWRDRYLSEDGQLPHTRLERPYLYLDPYDDGVAVAFPPQQFSSDISFSRLVWRLEENQRQSEIVADRNRTADGYEFTVPEPVAVGVAPAYRVTLCTDAEQVRAWTLTGLGEPPLLMFEPDSGAFLNERLAYQGGERWILYPNQYELKVTGGQKTAEMPQQFGEWGQYTIEGWELPPGSELYLISPEGATHAIKILDDLALKKPYFEGGTQPLNERSGFPLYSGRPPDLIFTFPQQPDPIQLSRWRITIRPEGAASLRQRRSYALTELSRWISIRDDNQACLDLSSPLLLGPKPCGKFEIHARGPYGRSRRLGLRIVPQLRLEGQHQLYLTSEDGAAHLHLFCDPASSIQCQTEGGANVTVKSGADRKHYQVQVEPSISLLRFVLVHQDTIRVPFVVRVRRLRWGLWQQASPDDFAWQTTPTRLYPAALVDISSTYLHVDLPTAVGAASLYGGWRLIDSQGNLLAAREPDLSRSRPQYDVALGELMPAFRQAQATHDVLRLQLWIRRPDQEERFVDALYLLPVLDLGETLTDWQESGEYAELSLAWESGQSSRHLQLALWPLDQPWVEAPLMLRVPESCREYAKWRVPTSKLPGAERYQGLYVGAMLIVDPWAPQLPSRPGRQQANVVTFRPSAADDYYGSLQTAVSQGTASPVQALTMLAYLYRNGHYDQMHQANMLVRQYATQGLLDLNQLMLWANLVRDTGDSLAYKLARWTLFSEPVLERIETELSESPLRQAYLSHLADDLLNPLAYIRLLMTGFSEVRRLCIAGLCRNRETIGIDALMEDVAAGKILVSEAAKIVAPFGPQAFDYLLEQRTADAMAVVSAVTIQTGASPRWIQPGFYVRTNAGAGIVRKILTPEENEKLAYCLPNDSCLLKIMIDHGKDTFAATINLAARTIRFKPQEVYECAVCGQVFSNSHVLVGWHYHACHPYEEKERFRLIRNRPIPLTELQVAHPPQGNTYAPTSHSDHPIALQHV